MTADSVNVSTKESAFTQVFTLLNDGQFLGTVVSEVPYSMEQWTSMVNELRDACERIEEGGDTDSYHAFIKNERGVVALFCAMFPRLHDTNGSMIDIST